MRRRFFTGRLTQSSSRPNGGSALDLERGLAPARRAGVRMQLWEVELEGAPFAGGADDGDLSAEDPGDLAADREPEPRSAVPAAGAAVRLLERFEDDLL